MNKFLFLAITSSLLLYSCSKDSDKITEYPQTFNFLRSDLKSFAGVAILDNNTSVPVGFGSGILKFFKDTFEKDYRGFLESTGGLFINRFTLINKDSIELSGTIDFDAFNITLPYFDSSGKLLIDTTNTGLEVNYNRTTGEMKLCNKLFAGIESFLNPPSRHLYIELTEDCNYIENPPLALAEYLSLVQKNNGDTLGVYFMEMIFKQR